MSQARRHLRDAARRGRAGRAGRDPLRHADAQERRAARLRLRQGAGAVEGQPGLLRAVRPCPRPLGAAPRAAEAGFATDDGALAAADLGAARRSRASLRVARKVAEWPRQVEIAAASHEPHRIAFYLYDLASEFHALQHQGKLDPALRFIREDAPEAHPRAAGAGARDAGGDRGRARHPRRHADERDALSRPLAEGFRRFRLYAAGLLSSPAPEPRCGKRIRKHFGVGAAAPTGYSVSKQARTPCAIFTATTTSPLPAAAPTG